MSTIQNTLLLLGKSKYPDDIIRYMYFSYLPKPLNNKSIREAVKLWCNWWIREDRDYCLKYYGHISDWDVHYVTDMSHLFEYQTTFNEDLSKWSTVNVCIMFNF